MRNLSILLALTAGSLALPAFAGVKDTTHQEVTMDTIQVTAPAGAPVYRGSAPRIWEIWNTRVALSFNWKDKTADVHEWIKLHPYFYATDTLMLDAKGMKIDSAMLVSKKGSTKLNYTYEKDVVKIKFDRQYQAADSVTLFFKYTAMPYAASTGGSAAISDDRGLYFINTDYTTPNKPAQIWTQGETESNSHWMITIDKPNSRHTTQIELTVPDSFATLSNGAMIKQLKGNKGMRTDIWRMDMPIQVYATMFAIGKYSIVKDKWRNKEVNYYVEPEYEKYARQMFKNTPEMMEYFSQRTGVAYPWNKYDQVVVRDYVSGAMENTTASLFGEFMNQDTREMGDKDWEDVVSHELFHMWFGDYATCESWTNLTVNESFANYGEQLWRAHKYGKVAGDKLSYDDLSGYIGSSQLKDPQLVRFYYDDKEEMFDAISYNKGGAILRYLNNLMGDAAFDKAMNIYLTKNALHSAEAHNWRMAVEEATGQDWNWFFNEWYYRAGHPVLKVNHYYNDTTQKLTVVVTQNQSDSTFMYRLPLKAALIYGSEKTELDWNISNRRDTFVYAYRNGVKPVIVPDYTHVLPGEVKDIKKPAQMLVQYMQCDDYISKRLALSAASKALSDSSSQALVDMALNDKIAPIRQLTILSLSSQQSDKYRKRWTGKITDMSVNDNDGRVRSEAFDVLSEWKVSNAKDKMLKGLGDSSYYASGSALEALTKIDADTAYVLAKRMLSSHAKSTLQTAEWMAIGKKAADEDIALFEREAPFVLGQRRISFVLALNSYVKNVKSDAAFGKAIGIYSFYIRTESMKNTRTALVGFLAQVAMVEKGNIKSDNKDEAATAQRRLAVVKTAFEQAVAAEKDPENVKDFQKMLKDNFE